MYKTFGDVVIDVFFELGNSVNKSTSASLKRWSGLCAKNQKLSVSKLTRIEDATLFEVVILGIFFTLKHIFSLTSGSKNCVATAAGI